MNQSQHHGVRGNALYRGSAGPPWGTRSGRYSAPSIVTKRGPVAPIQALGGWRWYVAVITAVLIGYTLSYITDDQGDQGVNTVSASPRPSVANAAAATPVLGLGLERRHPTAEAPEYARQDVRGTRGEPRNETVAARQDALTNEDAALLDSMFVESDDVPAGGAATQLADATKPAADDRAKAARFDGADQLWDSSVGERIRRIVIGDAERAHVSVSPDFGRLAAVVPERSIRVWKLADGELEHSFPHTTGLERLQFSPSGRQLFIADESGLVRLFNLSVGEVVLERRIDATKISMVSFTPDGRIQFGDDRFGSDRNGSSAPTPSVEQTDDDLGVRNYDHTAARHIAARAERIGRRWRSEGQCLRAVAQAISGVGIQLRGTSAYLAADQLKAHPRFREVSVSSAELQRLPAGAVVVWGQSPPSPHGHISVSLGDGREASDHVARQITRLRGYENYRVFVATHDI